MESTRPRTASSLGMFDLLKGAGMITIVFAHTAELYPLSAGSVSLTGFVFFIYREALMAAFYIASGYGFRKRSVGKCISQQFKTLLKPYLYTALATSILHLIVHYIAFRYFPSSVTETLKVLGGFALGLPHTAEYFGHTFFSCGPMWYLVAMAVGWIVLDIILNICPEKYVNLAVVCAAVLGWALCLKWELPFCIAQGLAVVPYLYAGFLLKKRRAFEQAVTKRDKLIILAAAAAVAAGAVVTGSTDCISMGTWTIGPLSIFLDGIVGYGLLRLFVLAGRSLSAPVRAISAVGRRSLQIFCVHTVELTAIPWYLFVQRFAAHPLAAMLAQYIIAMASILLITEALVRRRELLAKLGFKRRVPAARR